MIATRLHHEPQCRRSVPPERVEPQPEGVSVRLYRCPGCGAVAAAVEDADR